jgi:hypothetical protein
VVEHSIGNGEADSSILSGSTARITTAVTLSASSTKNSDLLKFLPPPTPIPDRGRSRLVARAIVLPEVRCSTLEGVALGDDELRSLSIKQKKAPLGP